MSTSFTTTVLLHCLCQSLSHVRIFITSMARSQDAMRKRAEKRNRSLPEQRRADGTDMRKQLEKENVAKRIKTEGQAPQETAVPEKHPHPRAPSSTDNSPLNEPGAWKCPGCGNHNFASRQSCHSVTCAEQRPAGVVVPPPYKKPVRHDPSTSKFQKWAKQADSQTVSQNQELRKLYLKTNGTGMDSDDVERAKILIARDERKKKKKTEKDTRKGGR